ncbi:MAG: UDP-3-O-(3-hydroxymyristoyl)glucosamine N-acyltransferase [Gammaproteobacteria bacterium]
MGTTLGELASRFDCIVDGDPDKRVRTVGTLSGAGSDAVAFLANPHYRQQLASTKAAAVIIAPGDSDACPVSSLIHSNPYFAYAQIAEFLCPQSRYAPGISERALVDPSAKLAEDVFIGAFSNIGENVVIGPRSVIGPGCSVAAESQLGSDCELVSGVTICQGTRIGSRVILQPGVVVGSDGFGLARSESVWRKVPQLGAVVLGDDVEIGANTTIDRGSIENTVIGNGVKLDNQIQVGHNVVIGEHTVIAGCVGISGSSTIGRRCMIAGQVGIAGHLEIADDVVVTGQTVVGRSITKAGVYSGALAMEETQLWKRNAARFRGLDDMAKRLKKLESDLEKRVSNERGTDD